MNSWIDRHRAVTLAAAALVPLLAAAVLAGFRASFENTNAALVLVLLVVAAASTGIRPAGLVAAVSSARSFDYFLTAPFRTLAITDRADIETAVLLPSTPSSATTAKSCAGDTRSTSAAPGCPRTPRSSCWCAAAVCCPVAIS
jgi:K+-sensing histidine kinase KdpD